MSFEMVALLLAVVAAAAGSVWALRVWRFAHRRKVGTERARGHLALRKRMAHLAGRRTMPEVQEKVMPAETMRGYVWLRATRRPRQPFHEEFGWSPFRWSARRAMRLSRTNSKPPWWRSPRRPLR